MKKNLSREFHLHFEQGWEFENHLKKTKGDIPKALKKMGSDRIMDGYKCFDLAERITEYQAKHQDAKISAVVDEQIIEFEGHKEFIEKLDMDGILFRMEDVENVCKDCISETHKSKPVTENE